MNHLARCFPATVQVTARKTAAIVPVDHAIRVQHRDHFENEVLSEDLRLLVFRIRQEVKQASHHPTADSLPRVHSSCEHDSFPLIIVFELVTARNCQNFTIFAAYCLAKRFPLHENGPLLVRLKLIEVFAKVCQ